MKNNNLLKNIIIPAAVFITAALPGYCAQAVPMKQTIIKFLMAMGGVALSTLLIYVGLKLYNKFFVNNENRTFGKDDTLATPNSTEVAVEFFIKKNKLR